MSGPWSLLLSFFPPYLSPSYLLALAPPVVDTIGMAFGAMFIAFCLGLPIAIATAMRLPGSKVVLSILTAFRAIPELTLAILCVILFGIGPGAGLVALALYYAAAVSKMFADILRTAPQGPLEALRATGASRLKVALFGLLPLKQADLLSYGAYEFESALRASIVVGAVGGGGLGSELVGSLAVMDFPRVTTQILVLVAVIAVFDWAAVRVRNYPRVLLVLFPIGLACAVAYGPRLFAFNHAIGVFGQMFPPEITAEGLSKLPGLLFDTVWMAAAGTAGAVAAALVFGPASARNLAPAWLAFPVRRLMELLRTLPEVVWGLVLITVIGVGPAAGAWALGLHSAGSLSRVFADSLENAPKRPQTAIGQTGASGFQVFAWATAPLALGPIAAHSLFRFEWNLRMATVLGLIGAGGVGQALYDAQQLMFYKQMMTYILITWVLIAALDRLSQSLRQKHGLMQMAVA
jgi:phosphonate transport system permease protein